MNETGSVLLDQRGESFTFDHHHDISMFVLSTLSVVRCSMATSCFVLSLLDGVKTLETTVGTSANAFMPVIRVFSNSEHH